MKISKLTIDNFRCFEHLEVDLHPEVNVFVGNNGSGKSAILDALALVLSRYVHLIEIKSSGFTDAYFFPMYSDFRVSNKSPEDKISIIAVANEGIESIRWSADYHRTNIKSHGRQSSDISDMNDITLLAGKILHSLINDTYVEVPVIAYYRIDRHVASLENIKPSRSRDFDRLGSYEKSLNASSNYNQSAEWFFFQEFEELQEGKRRSDLDYQLRDLRSVREAIATIIAPAAKVYFRKERSEGKAMLMISWQTDNDESREFTLSQLSGGYRNMLALVMDFARRMSQANPQMENPLEGPGILLIDEVDLHLHPLWQQRIIPDLKKVFPNTQLIVTTHSPEVLTTVKSEHVKVLEGNEVYDCPAPTFGMRSSDVVQTVLGLDSLRPPDNEVAIQIKKLFAAIDDENIAEARRICDLLRASDPRGFDPDLTRAELQLHRLERKAAK